MTRPSPRSLLARLSSISEPKRRAAIVELCESGLLTCTRGQPGENGATYALGWIPLSNPEDFAIEIRIRHAQNMLKVTAPQGRA